MQNKQIILQTYNYTGELEFLLPEHITVHKMDSANYGEVRQYRFRSHRLQEFLSLITSGLIYHLLHHGGDDDIFDNIPALIEETEQIFRLAHRVIPDKEAFFTQHIDILNQVINQVNARESLDEIDGEFLPITKVQDYPGFLNGNLEGLNVEDIYLTLRTFTNEGTNYSDSTTKLTSNNF